MNPNSELTRIIQESVISNGTAARDIAAMVGKPYPTLMREINPEDSGAKVGVESLVPLMEATSNIQPLSFLANTMGYVLIPLRLGEVSQDQANIMALDLMDGFGRYAAALKKAMGATELSKKDVSEVEKAGYEAMTAIMSMIQLLGHKAEPKEPETLREVAKAS